MNEINFSEISNTVSNILNGLRDGAKNGTRSKCFDFVLSESEKIRGMAEEILASNPERKLGELAYVLNAIAYFGSECRNRKLYHRKVMFSTYADMFKKAYDETLSKLA